MSQVIKDRDKFIQKDTRWDRIRKRLHNVNQFPLKTDVVRHFIERDYIGKQNEEKLINGDELGQQLNPSLVMDMRHKMFQKIPRKLPIATVANSKSLDACITHNLEIEERYMRNELNKIRQQVQRNYKINEIKRVKPGKPDLKLDNEPLMLSLENTTKHIEDFYAAPVEAIEKVAIMYNTEMQKAIQQQQEEEEKGHTKEEPEEVKDSSVVPSVDELVEKLTYNCSMVENEEHATLVEGNDYTLQSTIAKMDEINEDDDFMKRCRTPSPLTPTEEFLKPMRDAAERQMLHMRCVRFEDEAAIRRMQRENSSCSNTSDGIDSVISDLAEEALIELQIEAQEQHVCFKMEENAIEVMKETEMIQLEKVDPQPTQPDSRRLIEPPVKKIKPKIEVKEKNLQNDLHEPLLITRLELPKTLVNSIAEDTKEQSKLSEEDDDDDEVSTVSNQEQDQIITKLFQARAHTNLYTLRKYFRNWIHFTTIEKMERADCKARSDRVHKINTFLDNIRKEKKRIKMTQKEGEDPDSAFTATSKKNKAMEQREDALKIAKQYKNKIKVQQDIIDLQRVKLERQERMIMQLKLNKLNDEANEARQDLKQELKSFIRSGDPKSKAKAKCLQLIGNLRDAEDEKIARLQGKAVLQEKFLQNMQARAIERSIRHEQARQRRQQAEAEREAQKIAQEEAKRLEDEEAKRLRIEVLKEKRRVEKMAKVLKERERQRAIENNAKSKEFCRRYLLRRVGMEGFKRLLQRKRDNLQKCDYLRKKLYKRNYFIAWRNYTEFLIMQKNLKASNCYIRAQKRHAMLAWKLYAQEERSKLFVAIDWYALRLMESVINHWSNYTQRLNIIEETKMRQAISHHEWHLKWKVLDCWQRLPQILQLEKETEERRQRWRIKIWELLPDYKPNLEESLW